MSYAVKYALLKALSLETGDDADGEHIETGTVAPIPAREEPTPQTRGDSVMRAFWGQAKSAKIDEAGAHAYAQRNFGADSLKTLDPTQMGTMLTWVKGLMDAKRRLATQMKAAGVEPERELQSVLDTYGATSINELTLVELADAAKVYSNMADESVPFETPPVSDDPYGA
jgi:hypothetical protein